MRRHAFWAVLLSCTAPSWACQTGAERLTETHVEAIRDSLTDAIRRFGDASVAGDWDSVGTFYSDDPSFRFFENGQLQYGSAEGVRAALASLPSGTRIQTEYRETDIQPIAPGLAMVHTLFSTTMSDGAGMEFGWGGALTMLWAHEGGGWRIRSGHSSAPVPRGE